MLTYRKIDQSNLEYAIRIQEEIFPLESGRLNFEESINGISDFEYELLYLNEECVGVIGLYHDPADSQSAWLGWFGIREPWRKKHLGSEAMRHYEEKAREKGYRFARLYTDEFDNDTAIAFYKANGYTCERYENAEDPLSLKWHMLIFSKALYDEPLVKWNSRNIHLTNQLAKQAEGQKRKNAMVHEMNLNLEPFEKIKEGTKTIELRLYDEKRKAVHAGDTIIFTNTKTKETMETLVMDLYLFNSFQSLYEQLDLLECGYDKDTIDSASYQDMDAYYSPEEQKKYGVVGIRIAWKNEIL